MIFADTKFRILFFLKSYTSADVTAASSFYNFGLLLIVIRFVFTSPCSLFFFICLVSPFVATLLSAVHLNFEPPPFFQLLCNMISLLLKFPFLLLYYNRWPLYLLLSLYPLSTLFSFVLHPRSFIGFFSYPGSLNFFN